MNRYVLSIATFLLAASSLVFAGVANAERAKSKANKSRVTWKNAPGKILKESSASAGTKMVKDQETGQLRAARAGEVPEAAAGSATQIITRGGGAIAVAGDDLMSDMVATKQADGTVTVGCGHGAEAHTHAEVK